MRSLILSFYTSSDIYCLKVLKHSDFALNHLFYCYIVMMYFNCEQSIDSFDSNFSAALWYKESIWVIIRVCCSVPGLFSLSFYFVMSYEIAKTVGVASGPYLYVICSLKLSFAVSISPNHSPKSSYISLYHRSLVITMIMFFQIFVLAFRKFM